MTTETGDLLAITRGIIAHQTNTVGATGGLAGALRRKWPHAFIDYARVCIKTEKHLQQSWADPLGRTLICKATYEGQSPVIAHVFGQRYPGANTDLIAVDSALADLADQISADPFYEHLPIYVPYLMGCGLGGGRWDQYLPLLEKHLPSATIIQLPA